MASRGAVSSGAGGLDETAAGGGIVSRTAPPSGDAGGGGSVAGFCSLGGGAGFLGATGISPVCSKMIHIWSKSSFVRV
jgi:hypothetical protein